MSDDIGGHPQFSSAMRGYDRLQVDEYVASLLASLGQAQERARVAEAEIGEGAPATIGPRVTEIFDLALAEVAELRERAQTEVADSRARVQAEAGEMLAGANRRCDDLVAAAERDAESITAQARAQREEMLTETERQRELASAQVIALERRKGRLVEELRRLQEALGSAADSVAEGVTEPPAWNEAGDTKTIEIPLELPPPDPQPPAQR
jgi:cell division septum initiation protein DivIVA